MFYCIQSQFSLWRKVPCALFTMERVHERTRVRTHTHTFLAGWMGFQTFRHCLLLTLMSEEQAAWPVDYRRVMGAQA